MSEKTATHKLATMRLLQWLKSENHEVSLRAAAILLGTENVLLEVDDDPLGVDDDPLDSNPELTESEMALAEKIVEVTGRAVHYDHDADGGAVVTYYFRDKHGNVQTRTRKNSTSAHQDRMKHALRAALQSARKDHVPE